ncbi:calcium-binding protein CML [Saccharothrix carnea]|uniref:Calcium-binding protein CML n=1 Tax=Saccharothrix carnea TaxID=1280637 RepID=A0A2P8IGT8_SACCR|nr:EF-hand domain-containing protein [Saccharothrix carnea]PSL57671.1 calcium-binding protein CML [Saccharothrix carnea]
MSGDLRMDNVDRVFAVFDVDGDGGISWGDFSAAAVGVGREFGLGVESSEVRGLVAAYREVWEYIVGADLDADGAVSRGEFRDAHEAGRLSMGGLLEKWLAVSGRNFELADRDGDGRLDGSEFAGIYRGNGVTDPQVAAIAFAGMDLDGDGRLDLVEFQTHVRGFFTEADVSAKGTHLLGDV